MAKKDEKPQEQDDSVLLEVREQMAEERTQRLLKKYGPFLGYCAIGIVLLFGGYEAWKNYDTDKRQVMGDKFLEASENPEGVELSNFEGQHGFTQLAKMARANKMAENDDKAGAIAEYESVWKNTKNDAAIRKTAKIRAAILMINADNAETPKWLNSDDDIIFNSQFNELAAIHSLQTGNLEKAEKALNKLNESEQITANVKNRVDVYLSEIEAN